VAEYSLVVLVRYVTFEVVLADLVYFGKLGL
jgi:hypothetical protein